jgi:hypothetical protein
MIVSRPLWPADFEVQRFHQAVVARLKRGLLASEQKTEKFRQEKKRMKKQIEEGSIQNFSLSSLREAPVEAQLSRLAFEELQTSNTEADYLDFADSYWIVLEKK